MSTQAPGLMTGPNIDIEMQMLATILSAFVFGLILSLSSSCFQLVYQKCQQKSGHTSTRTYHFLLAYIAIMTGLSMASVIVDIHSLTSTIFTPHGISKSLFELGYAERFIFILLVVWGADGFMVRFLYNVILWPHLSIHTAVESAAAIW